MNFLGMGPAELIVIIVIALIVLGPGKLPEVARALGKTMRDLRSISDGFQTELRKELNTATSVKDEINPLSETLSSLRSSLNATSAPTDQKPKEKPASGSEQETLRVAQSDGSTRGEAAPDISFAEHYQAAQGGVRASENVPPDESAAGDVGKAPAQPGEILRSAQNDISPESNDDLPLEYVGPFSGTADQKKTE